MPTAASSIIENYIEKCRRRLSQHLTQLPQSTTSYDYKKQSIFKNIIDSLTTEDTIIITQADKNMGPVIVDRTWYEKEALRQLSDTSTYTRLLAPPPSSILKNSLLTILQRHEISDNSKLYKYLLQPFKKYSDNEDIPCANFYMLIKLHKPPPTPMMGRPIAASIRSLTYNASKLLDKHLQPIMKKFNSYLKNSFDIIEIIEERSFPPDSVILTGDVNNLYPSINIADGLSAVKAALQLFSSYPSSLINLILDLLEWVLRNNYISFGDTFWLQIKGTAMGTPVAVTFANIYLSMLEYELAQNVTASHSLDLSAILIYKRYIDDIFAIFSDMESARLYTTLFNNLRPDNIRVDFHTSMTSGVILDISILKGLRFVTNGHFDITLFQKECNKYLYIPPFSFHPRPVFRGFINSELQRIRLHCSNDLDFHSNEKKFYNRLRDRGYSTNLLDSLFPFTKTRNEIFLNRKTKKYAKLTSITSPVMFTTDYTPLQQGLNWNSIFHLDDTELLDPIADLIFHSRRPVIAYKNASTLRNHLTQSNFPHSVKNII